MGYIREHADTDEEINAIRLGLRQIVGLTILAFGIYFMSSIVAIHATRTYGPIASIWFANAILLGLLWRTPSNSTIPLFLAGFTANICANLFENNDLFTSTSFAIINMVEVSVAYYALRVARTKLNAVSSYLDISKLLLITVILAPVISAGMADLFFWIFKETDPGTIILTWFVSDSLGMAILAPTMLFFRWEAVKERLGELGALRAALLLLGFVGLVIAVFAQSEYPILFAVFPALIFVVYSCGFSCATVSLAFVAITAIVATTLGTGPLTIVADDMLQQAFVLQCFLVLSVATILPFAAQIAKDQHVYQQMVTARREAENLKLVAEAANHAKSNFLTSMSHELRTPLNAICGFGQILKSNGDNLSKKQIGFIETIISSSNHIVKMVDDILDLSKIENDAIKLEIQKVEVSELVGRALEIMYPLIDEGDIKLYRKLNQADAIIDCDPARTQQVLLNLLTNAIKYNRPGGFIELSGEVQDKNCLIKVRDNGEGIPEELGMSIFEAFNRGVQGLGTETGAGVGLSICKRLVEAMGGEIGYNVVESGGSEFWFKLPLAQNIENTEQLPTVEALETKPVPEKLPNPPKTRAIILYAEDNMWNAKLLPDVLSPLKDLDVHIASNGKETLQMVQQLQPDVIILDIHLPDIDGFELLQKIRADSRFSNTPIFALTADASYSARIRGKEAGFDEWINKPFALEDIQDKIWHAAMQSSGSTHGHGQNQKGAAQKPH